ncbi:hypothetical protein HK405_013303 [Cladochytrium tenue]|nr:hypothetical protein HK405_013303 [Cladochytrium tenue]
MVSYSWGDKVVARAVATFLESNGFKVWIDVDRMADNINEAMLTAIQNSRVIMPFISEAYIESRNCKLEIYYAHEQNKKFLPIQLSSSNKVVDSAAYYFTAGMLYVELGPQVWDNRTRKSMALREILRNLSILCRTGPHDRTLKNKKVWWIILGVAAVVIVLVIAIALGVHFATSNSGGGGSSASAGGEINSSSKTDASVVGTNTDTNTFNVGTTSTKTTTTTSSTTTSSAAFGGAVTTLPTYFQIKRGSTNTCIVAAASGSSYEACEAAPASDSHQVLTAPYGQGDIWMQTSSSECLSFFSFYLEVVACSRIDTFQTLSFVDDQIVDGFGSCLPDNLETLGGTGCGTFSIVEVTAS